MCSGVSVVICCHNGAMRLPQTLDCLKSQVNLKGIPWEVILIDNASTDSSAALAQELWEENSLTNMRIIHEGRLGLSIARQTGFANSTYDLISFVDDDNRVESEWVGKVFKIMKAHPEVGACGGRSNAVYESPPPKWLLDHQDKYAIGSQANRSGDITRERGWLWGSGLTIRKKAWQQLIDLGFAPSLTDRQGIQLSTGGDIEICLALRLAGWRIWYDDDLILWHYIPASRMRWNYLCALMTANGEAGVYLKAYERVYKNLTNDPGSITNKSWITMLFAKFHNMLSHHPLKLIAASVKPLEGDSDLLYLRYEFGYLRRLIGMNHREYIRWVRSLNHTSWCSTSE